MRNLFFVAMLFLFTPAVRAQGKVRDLSTDRTSSTRKAILEALRGPVSSELKQPVSFVVEVLKTDGNWAFMRGKTVAANGGEIDFGRVPAYAQLVRDGLFDGGGTAALLRRQGNTWRYATHVIGPTDVAWACWWKEYKAPRAIFDLAESGCR